MKNPRARPSGVAPSRLSFQTAGKREIIEVPEEEVGLARDLLDSSSLRTSFSAVRASQTTFDPSTPGAGTFSLKESRISFQTAGRGQTIEAPDEDLLRARNLLSGSPRAKMKDMRKAPPGSFEAQTPAVDFRNSRPLHTSFQFAGKEQIMKSGEGSSKQNVPIQGQRRVSFHTAGNGKVLDTPEEDLEQVKHLFSSTSANTQFYGDNTNTTTREFKTPGPGTRNPYSPAVVTFPSERKQDLAGVVKIDPTLAQDPAGGTSHRLSNLRTPVSESVYHRPARLSFNNAPSCSAAKKLKRDPKPNHFCNRILKDADPPTEAPRVQKQPPTEPNQIHGQVGKASDRLGVPLRETKKMVYSHETSTPDAMIGRLPLFLSNTDETKENLSPDDLPGGDHGVAVLLPCNNMSVSGLSVKHRMTKSCDECAEYGVAQVLLSIDGVNGASVSFGDDGLPVDLSMSNYETEKKLRQGMAKHGCDCSKISSKWIKNHFRWISWKLASIERRFPHLLVRPYFTMQRLLDELVHRFKRELVDGLRSPLRKVLNRDVAPSSMMILCVAKLNLSQKKPADCENAEDEPGHTMELTDGWYSVLAKPDRFLCELIDRWQIRVGTKLLVSNSSLHGSEDAIDPLDEEYQCSSGTYLRVFTNSTRLASWDSKLGFVKMDRFLKETDGSLHIRNMRDIVEGGGRVPSIDFRVVKKYPLLFLHQTGNGKSSVLTESEEDNRLRRLEDARAKLAEEISGELEEECSKVRIIEGPVFVVFTILTPSS
eukprot:scaffold12124_cov137-Amphora_coffeaeformis.AAC.1